MDWAGLAAIITAIGGIVTIVLSHRSTKKEEEDKCLERLRKAREESEGLAEELHKLKMSHWHE